VRVRVPALQRQAITVPQKAVTELQGLKTVYVVGPHDQPQARQITASHRVGNDWVVDKGLQPGERVIVDGFEKMQMRPGMPIKPVMVAASSEDVATPPPAAAPPAAPAAPGPTGKTGPASKTGG
jgi:membrane fusion protein (multidrug efflux system)